MICPISFISSTEYLFPLVKLQSKQQGIQLVLICPNSFAGAVPITPPVGKSPKLTSSLTKTNYWAENKDDWKQVTFHVILGLFVMLLHYR